MRCVFARNHESERDALTTIPLTFMVSHKNVTHSGYMGWHPNPQRMTRIASVKDLRHASAQLWAYPTLGIHLLTPLTSNCHFLCYARGSDRQECSTTQPSVFELSAWPSDQAWEVTRQQTTQPWTLGLNTIKSETGNVNVKVVYPFCDECRFSSQSHRCATALCAEIQINILDIKYSISNSSQALF